MKKYIQYISFTVYYSMQGVTVLFSGAARNKVFLSFFYIFHILETRGEFGLITFDCGLTNLVTLSFTDCSSASLVIL